MKYFWTFLLCFLMIVAGLCTLPSVQDKVTARLLTYFEESFGIEVQGEAKWTLFPLTLHLNQVVFDTLQADKIHIGLTSFAVQSLKGPEFEEIDANGVWQLDYNLRPCGTLEAHHSDRGALKLLFSFQEEQRKKELCFHLSANSPAGYLTAEGALPIPRIGLKAALETSYPLFAQVKMHWQNEDIGSALGYMTLGWEKGWITLPHLEVAGTLLDVPFTIERKGDPSHPLFDLSLLPVIKERSVNIFGELALSNWNILQLRKGTFACDGKTGSFDAFWDLENKQWDFSAHCPKAPFFDRTLENIFVEAGGAVGELVPLIIGMTYQENPLFLKGQLSFSLDGLRLLLNHLEGSVDNLPLSLEEPARLSVFKEGWNLDHLHLKTGDAFFKLNGYGLNGRALCAGEVKGLEGFVPKLPFFPLSGTFKLEATSLSATLNGSFRGANQETIEAEGTLSLSGNEAINGIINCKGELSPYLSRVLPDTTSASGRGEGYFTFSGTLQDPLFEGKLSLRKGVYEDLITGMRYHDMECDFLLDGSRVDIVDLSALDATGGMIVGKGEVTLNEEIPFALYLEARHGEVVNIDYAFARATGMIKLSGDRNTGSFDGELKIEDSVIRLPEKTPLMFQKLDIVYEKIETEEEKAPWKMAWNLDLDFQEGVNVSSGLFKSEWKGSTSLQGSTDAPLLFGKGALIRADFNFNGKHFESTDGVVLFQGEPGSKTSFYVTAKQEIEDLKIEIILKGPLKSPEIAFRSNPPKPTKEILSYLLLNRGTGSDEMTPLASSAIKLDSATTETTFLDKFKSSIGIDRIELSGEDDEALSLEIGKYIIPSLYLCVKKSVTDGPDQAAVVAKFPNHFKAQGEVELDGAEGKFMLKWERDY